MSNRSTAAATVPRATDVRALGVEPVPPALDEQQEMRGRNEFERRLHLVGGAERVPVAVYEQRRITQIR
ncbi:hypothetical protein GS451_25825 [Rhodococcus hoagii]|nr:hypothetical protein [Prescottella equi]